MFYNSIVRRVEQSETLVRQFKERTRLSARNSLRADKRIYSRLVRYLRCWDKKVQLGNRTIGVNLRKYLSVYEHFLIGMTIETVIYLVRAKCEIKL